MHFRKHLKDPNCKSREIEEDIFSYAHQVNNEYKTKSCVCAVPCVPKLHDANV